MYIVYLLCIIYIRALKANNPTLNYYQKKTYKVGAEIDIFIVLEKGESSIYFGVDKKYRCACSSQNKVGLCVNSKAKSKQTTGYGSRSDFSLHVQGRLLRKV